MANESPYNGFPFYFPRIGRFCFHFETPEKSKKACIDVLFCLKGFRFIDMYNDYGLRGTDLRTGDGKQSQMPDTCDNNQTIIVK